MCGLKDLSISELIELASLFQLDGTATTVEPFGNGNVNDTFLIRTDSDNRHTLQRINHDVFKDPVSLMENFARVTAHLAQKHMDGQTTLQTLALVPAKDGSAISQVSMGTTGGLPNMCRMGCPWRFRNPASMPMKRPVPLGIFSIN